MAAIRGTGLTAEQVSELRDHLAAGRRPRVGVKGSQFAEGTTGTVTRVGDPAVDGDDFVTVRVKVNGVMDDLLFGPQELSRGKSGQAGRPAKGGRTVAPANPATRPVREPATSGPPRPARARRAAAPTTAAPQTAPKRTARRTSASAPVTITIRSAGASWSVSAQRGSRSVLKHAAVNPGVVAAIAGLLDQRAVEEAVSSVNDTARVEAESRAEQLRAELAQVQAVLDSHRRP
jgi:hypothetical protein